MKSYNSMIKWPFLHTCAGSSQMFHPPILQKVFGETSGGDAAQYFSKRGLNMLFTGDWQTFIE